MESRRKTEWEEITPEDSISREVKEPPKFEEVFIEPETPLVAPLKEVAVVVPPLTAAVMADEEPEMKDGTGAAEDSLTQRSGREESLSGEEKAAAVGAAVSMAASIAASETADALSGSEIEETEDKEDKTEDKRQKKMRPRKRRSSLPFVKRKKRQSSDIQMSSLLTPLTVTIAAAAMTAAVMYFLPKKK